MSGRPPTVDELWRAAAFDDDDLAALDRIVTRALAARTPATGGPARCTILDDCRSGDAHPHRMTITAEDGTLLWEGLRHSLAGFTPPHNLARLWLTSPQPLTYTDECQA